MPNVFSIRSVAHLVLLVAATSDAARAVGASLVLEEGAGKHDFEDTDLNGTRPMHDFDRGLGTRAAMKSLP